MGESLQILVSLLCNVAPFTYGLQAGWLAPMQPLLQSNGSSPLGKQAPPLTDEQISWIGSLPSIEFIFVAPFFCFIVDKFGRKLSLLLTTAPNIIAYLLLIFANDVNFIYISRLVGGFCSTGCFIVGPIYINETAGQSLKGTLGGLMGFFIKVGIILSFTLGAYTSYLTLNLVSLSFTAVFLVFYPFIPESPVYLMKINKKLEAEKAYVRLLGENNRHSIKENMKSVEKAIAQDLSKGSYLQNFKKLFTERRLRKAMIIVAAIFTFQPTSGYPAIVRYTVNIFESAGGEISPYNAAIMLAFAQILFSFIGAFLLDRLGRKRILQISLILMSLSLATISLYLYNRSYFIAYSILNNIPTIALISFISAYACGFGTVPFVIIPELFSPETRAMACTYLNIWFSFVEFFVLKTFPSLAKAIELQGMMAVFAISGMIGTVFLSFYMFETSGLDFETIQKKLSGKYRETKHENGKSILTYEMPI